MFDGFCRVDHAERVAALEQLLVAGTVADLVDVEVSDLALQALSCNNGLGNFPGCNGCASTRGATARSAHTTNAKPRFIRVSLGEAHARCKVIWDAEQAMSG